MYHSAEAHPGPSQASKINLFARIVYLFIYLFIYLLFNASFTVD